MLGFKKDSHTSTYFSLSFFSFLFQHFSTPFSVAQSPPPFIGVSSSLILPTGLFLARFSRIFSPSLLVFPLSYLETRFLGVFILFRLSYTYLMRQMLGKEPLINAEVKISVILIYLGDFPRSYWDTLWIIHTYNLG